MFGVDTSELLLVAILALLFIGPKDLPRAMRAVGHWIGKVRGMARHFNTGIEAMIREAELEEMEKQWRAENERIMREFPSVEQALLAEQVDQPGLPLDDPEERPPPDRPLP